MQVENQTPNNTRVASKQAQILQERLSRDQEKNAHKRRFERHTVFAVATMIILDSSQHIEGVITEVSQGGIKFRPASLFLLERNSERVSIILDDVKTTGTIRASRADGYGIQLIDKLDENDLQFIIDNYASNN
ncbi:MAG: PilZ domain-containing protein [Devosiaceae bacterium]|nr:PilZ domain-containing protein [Devosiaceae bacterium]